MKFKNGMVLTQVGKDFVDIPTGDAAESFCGILRLNCTAVDIWHGIEAENTVEQIAAVLVEKYSGVTIDHALSSINRFISSLYEIGIMVHD